MNDRYIILKGCAGLGNRLITLSSAIEYAQKTNRTLMVDWSDGQFGVKGKNIFYDYFILNKINNTYSYDEIFSPENKLSCYPPVWGKKYLESLYDLYIYDHASYLPRIFQFKSKGAISKIRGYWRQKDNKNQKIGKDWQAFKSIFKKNDIPMGRNYKTNLNYDVIFFADFCPRFSHDTLRKHISLENSLAQEIDEIAYQLGLKKNTVGVHVRMTDKQPETSLDILFNKIKNININTKKIFLSTDNEEVEKRFRNNFHNVIYTQKWRPEGSGKQMGTHQYSIRSKDYSCAEILLKESIIDMWLLSKCEYLIYQKNSSFSKISSILKNQPEKIYKW